MKIDSRHKCPYCGFTYQTAYGSNVFANLLTDPDETVAVHSIMYVCPYLECRKIEVHVDAGAFPANMNGRPQADLNKIRFDLPAAFFRQRLLPFGQCGKPEFRVDAIPDQVFWDYNEACRLLKLSPNASATYGRRCLQKILRHRFKVKPGKFQNEIHALSNISTPVGQEIIEVLDRIRKYGKIASLPEDDVKILVDVTMDEAEQIIEVIEVLMYIWYLAPAEKDKKLCILQSIVRKRSA